MGENDTRMDLMPSNRCNWLSDLLTSPLILHFTPPSNELIEYKVVLRKVQKRENGIDTLPRLPDELLLEILFRLSCSESAIRCKSVCKRWASLISSPFFIASFTLDKNRKHIELFCTSIRGYPHRA